jgi:enterochelin esterase family protein
MSQSGSFQWYPGAFEEDKETDTEPGVLTRQFVTTPLRPVRFYLEAGRFEHDFSGSLLAENRRLRDVLEAKGYAVHYSEFTGGHDYQTWRGSFADALIVLTGTAQR